MMRAIDDVPAEASPAQAAHATGRELWGRANRVVSFVGKLEHEHASMRAAESQASLIKANRASNLNYDSADWLVVLRPAAKGVMSRFVVIPWLVLTVAAFIAEVFELLGSHMIVPTPVPVAVGGLMSLLLAFRLNSSFSRWWEARNLWGGLIVSARALMMQLVAIDQVGDDDAAAEDGQSEADAAAAAWTLAFACALRQHLRGAPLPSSRADDPRDEMPQGLYRLLSARQLRELAESTHAPLYALRQLRLALEPTFARLKRPAFEATCTQAVGSMLGALTGCERILRTPCPPGYVGLLRCVCFFWMLMMPFTLVDVLGWLMIPVISLTSLLVLAIEQLSVQIENPFGDDANDLPLGALCLTVEADLLRALLRVLAEERRAYKDFDAAP